jgi:putative DNA primase/helicase
LRYVAPWGKWLWLKPGGCRWIADATLYVFDLIRQVCREAAAECAKPSIAAAIASGNTVAAVEKLARSDRRLAATVDQWDADPWLLNTPAGALDLRTGETCRRRPQAYLTKSTTVKPAGDYPIWCEFLKRITEGNEELERFLQRMAGYCLTGSTREHALFFLYGTGANGKSVLLNTLSGILGDYARSAPIETFTASSVERHPTDLASLRGARLVMAVETEEGRRWAESRIKVLTGGDKIAARFMRQDFFEFTPQFKLVIAGNHKPGLRSVDEAIRRRFHLVPFAVTIPPRERDETLTERLKKEWPGILSWMIEGCHAWLEQGLAPPEIVEAATAAYLEAEDAVTAWLDEACERDPDAWEGSSALFASWRAWAEKAGEYPGTMKRLVQNLEARGFIARRRMNGRGFEGLRIKPIDLSEAYWNR